MFFSVRRSHNSNVNNNKETVELLFLFLTCFAERRLANVLMKKLVKVDATPLDHCSQWRLAEQQLRTGTR